MRERMHLNRWGNETIERTVVLGAAFSSDFAFGATQPCGMRGKLSGGTSQDTGTVGGEPCGLLVLPGDFISIGGELK